MTEPLDETHAMCINARDRIRDRAAEYAREIHAWAPRPCPPIEEFR